MGAQETEKYRAGSKSGLENYCSTVQSTLNEETLKDKFECGAREQIEKATQDALNWLDEHESREAHEFEAKQKQLEAIVNPIMMKAYQTAAKGTAKKDPAEDKAKIAAKNELAKYCFNTRKTLSDEGLKGKLGDADTEAIENAVKDALDWLNRSQ